VTGVRVLEESQDELRVKQEKRTGRKWKKRGVWGGQLVKEEKEVDTQQSKFNRRKKVKDALGTRGGD